MRTRRRLVGRSAATLAALAAVGCSDGTGPVQDDGLLLNAAAVVADATVEDVTLAMAGFQFGPQAVGGMGGAGEPGGRRGIGGHLSGTREVTFLDAANVEQDAYDPLTTASVHLLLDVAGDVERGPWSASIARTRDWTVSGLEGEETTRTFNGTGSETVSRSRTLEDGAEATHAMSGTLTYTDVVVPIPGSDPKWPLSGTVHRTMNVTVVNGPRGDYTKTLDALVTFNGTQTVTAIIDGEEVEIDLATRQGFFPIRRGRFGRGGGGG